MLDFLSNIPNLDAIAFAFALLSFGMILGVVVALDLNQASAAKRREELSAELDAMRATERLAQVAWTSRQAMHQAAEDARGRRQTG